MPWAKIDDQFYDHPKVIEAGPIAVALFVCGLSYCNRHLTDGFISAAQARRLIEVDEPIAVADKLVKVGLWEKVEGGYRVHDYLDYNMPAKQIRAERELAKERMRRQARDNQKRTDGETLDKSSGEVQANCGGSSGEVQANCGGSSGEVQLPQSQSQSQSQSDCDSTNKKDDGNPERPRDPFFDAICAVCNIDPSIKGNGGKVGKVKQELLGAKPPYSPEEVLAFGEWWNSDEWRKTKKGPPSLLNLKEQIGIVRGANGNRNRKPVVSSAVKEYA